MNSTTVSFAQQVAKCLTLLILVLSMVDLSVGLPSSSKLVNNRLFAHMIKTRSSPRRYCGRHIVNILSMVCDGNYFGPSKRTHLIEENKSDSLNNAITTFWEDIPPKDQFNKPEDEGSEDLLSDDFLEPKEAMNIFESVSTVGDGFTRNRRGIVDECCRKSCTIRELSSYCE